MEIHRVPRLLELKEALAVAFQPFTSYPPQYVGQPLGCVISLSPFLLLSVVFQVRILFAFFSAHWNILNVVSRKCPWSSLRTATQGRDKLLKEI